MSSVDIGGVTIRYEVARSARRHKTVQLTMLDSGDLLLTAPLRTSVSELEAIVRRRATWIQRRREAFAMAVPPRRYESGEDVPYLGRTARLVVASAPGRVVSVRLRAWRLEVGVPATFTGDLRRARIAAALERWYRLRAGARIAARTARFARAMRVKPARILIRDQRRRWGSCGPDGVLRFNWRLVLAPPALLDYVVVHELAHLRDKTHGPRFWAIVAGEVPDHRARRTRLRQLAPTLTR